MNSREIVQRTFDFQCPTRVAHSFYPSDLVWAGIHIDAPQNDWKRVGELDWRRIDEWGNVWQKKKYVSKGKIIRGGLHNIKEIKSYRFPDFSDPSLYTTVTKAFTITSQSWHIGVLTGSTFEIANSIIDCYYSHLLKNIEYIRNIHDCIDSILKSQITMFKKAGADSIMIVEDLGETSQIPLGPTLWRDEFRPRLQSLCNHAHNLNLKVIMHSLQETALIPELISCGIDCIQIDSPDSVGLDVLQTLRELYRITFWCPIDIHSTLQLKNETAIRMKAQEMLEMLWKGEGGFIAGYYWDNISIGLDPQWQEFACDEFRNYGKFENFKGNSTLKASP